MKPNFYKFGNKLNSIYLNLNQKVSYQQYCAQNLSSGDRLDRAVQEWPNNKLLVKFKKEVAQKQIAFVDLAKIKGLHSDAVKRQQTMNKNSLTIKHIFII